VILLSTRISVSNWSIGMLITQITPCLNACRLQISRWSEDSHDSDDDTPNGWDNGDDGDSDGDSDEGSDGGSHGRANAGRNSSNAGSEMGASDDGEDPEGMEVPEVSEEASDSEEGPRISGVANSDADYTSNASWKGASEAHLEHTAPADM